jgi:hypothetical protein
VTTNYQRGRAFEYRTRDKLYKMGAVYVMRAAQSKGAADLIALFPAHPVYEWPRVWLVQCKRGTGRISPAEREILKNLAREAGVVPVQALPGPKGRGVVFTDLNSMEEI